MTPVVSAGKKVNAGAIAGGVVGGLLGLLLILLLIWFLCLRRRVEDSDEDEDMAAKRAKLMECRDAMLGPRETRDGRRVWFEEQPRANAVRGGPRCYGISNMYERQMNATGPPAALKVVNGELDAVQLAVKNMVQVMCLLLSTSCDLIA